MGFIRVSGYSQDDIDQARISGASGNATPSDVLSGKTFSSNGTSNQTGTMPNRGSLSVSLGRSVNTSASVSAGYYSGGTVSVSDASETYTITSLEVNKTTYSKDLGAKNNVRYVNYKNVFDAGVNEVKSHPSTYFGNSDLTNETIFVSLSGDKSQGTSKTSEEYTCLGDGWCFVHTYNFSGNPSFKGTVYINSTDVWHQTQNRTEWFAVSKGDKIKTKIELTGDSSSGSANTRAVVVTFKS